MVQAMLPKKRKRKRKKSYFDAKKYNVILVEIQDLYKKKDAIGLLPMEQERLDFLMNEEVML